MATQAQRKLPPQEWKAPVLAESRPVEPRLRLSLPIPPGDRRAFRIALLISAALHLLVLLLYPLVDQIQERPVPRSLLIAPPLPDATEVVIIGLPGLPGAPEAPAPQPVAPPVRRVGPALPGPTQPSPRAGAPTLPAAPGVPDVAPSAGVPGAPATGAAGVAGDAPRSAAERLRPGVPDVRLWTFDSRTTQLTEEQIMKLELLWTIMDMGATAAEAAEAARRLSDWTFTDSSGKRWGFADGKVYLGDLVLPFPFSFSAPPNSDAANRAWIDAEIERAAGSAAARENMKERIKAIRERLEQERRRLKNDSTKTPPKP